MSDDEVPSPTAVRIRGTISCSHTALTENTIGRVHANTTRETREETRARWEAEDAAAAAAAADAAAAEDAAAAAAAALNVDDVNEQAGVSKEEEEEKEEAGVAVEEEEEEEQKTKCPLGSPKRKKKKHNHVNNNNEDDDEDMDMDTRNDDNDGTQSSEEVEKGENASSFVNRGNDKDDDMGGGGEDQQDLTRSDDAKGSLSNGLLLQLYSLLDLFNGPMGFFTDLTEYDDLHCDFGGAVPFLLALGDFLRRWNKNSKTETNKRMIQASASTIIQYFDDYIKVANEEANEEGRHELVIDLEANDTASVKRNLREIYWILHDALCCTKHGEARTENALNYDAKKESFLDYLITDQLDSLSTSRWHREGTSDKVETIFSMPHSYDEISKFKAYERKYKPKSVLLHVTSNNEHKVVSFVKKDMPDTNVELNKELETWKKDDNCFPLMIVFERIEKETDGVNENRNSLALEGNKSSSGGGNEGVEEDGVNQEESVIRYVSKEGETIEERINVNVSLDEIDSIILNDDKLEVFLADASRKHKFYARLSSIGNVTLPEPLKSNIKERVGILGRKFFERLRKVRAKANAKANVDANVDANDMEFGGGNNDDDDDDDDDSDNDDNNDNNIDDDNNNNNNNKNNNNDNEDNNNNNNNDDNDDDDNVRGTDGDFYLGFENNKKILLLIAEFCNRTPADHLKFALLCNTFRLVASDLSAIVKIVAHVIQPAITAEQEAEEKAKQIIRDNDKKGYEGHRKIKSKFGFYTGDFDGSRKPSGYGTYLENKPRRGIPVGFESFGEFKNGDENGSCKIIYKDEVKSKYLGEVSKGERSGDGVSYYNDSENKRCSHIGSWNKGKRQGFGLIVHGLSCTFGWYEEGKPVGTHVSWEFDRENRGGDNVGDNNIDDIGGGNYLLPNNKTTYNNQVQSEVVIALTCALPICRVKQGSRRKLRGAKKQEKIDELNKEGTGAKGDTITDYGNCVHRNLKPLMKVLMEKDGTHDFYGFDRNNTVGRQTRSKGLVQVRVNNSEIDELLVKGLKLGRTPNGWIADDQWQRFIKQELNLNAKFLDISQAKWAVLEQKDPVLVVVRLAVKAEFKGEVNKETGMLAYKENHMIRFIPGTNEPSKLIDPDGDVRVLTTTEMKWMVKKPNQISVPSNKVKIGKKIFEDCLGKKYSSVIKGAYLITRAEP